MNETIILQMQAFDWNDAWQITLAALLGGLLGIEREWGGHDAGLRTNIMIAVSSCLFTILSIKGFPMRGAAQDTARVAAQIVTGVGFLGAGVLIRQKTQVRGLTTAATIWLVSAIGMAVGTGANFLAVFTTLLAVSLLVILSPIRTFLGHHQPEDMDHEPQPIPKQQSTSKQAPATINESPQS